MIQRVITEEGPADTMTQCSEEVETAECCALEEKRAAQQKFAKLHSRDAAKAKYTRNKWQLFPFKTCHVAKKKETKVSDCFQSHQVQIDLAG